MNIPYTIDFQEAVAEQKSQRMLSVPEGRQACAEFGMCNYYESNAINGLHVETVFKEGRQREHNMMLKRATN